MIGAPSLRYWVHLVAPGWNVIGGGEPAIPGVSIGHNEHGAWGLTIFGNDSEDLYVYETNPDERERISLPRPLGADARRQRHDCREGRAAACGRAEVHASRAGALRGSGTSPAYALRAAWLEPGGAPYLASLRMDQATTWDEFREACTLQPHAGGEHDLGRSQRHHRLAGGGHPPLRRNWSGLLPVPGDGRYEWDGYLPDRRTAARSESGARLHRHGEQLPVAERLSAQGARCTYDWADPFRSSRIAEVLGSGRALQRREMTRLQNDDLVDPGAARWCRCSATLSAAERARGAGARSAPAGTSCSTRIRSAAGVYAMWQRRLIANTQQAVLAPTALRGAAARLHVKRLIDALNAPDARFGEQPTHRTRRAARSSLDEAVAELTKRFGPGRGALALAARPRITTR